VLQLERERPGAPFIIALSAHAIIIIAAIWKSFIALPGDASALERSNEAESTIDIILFADKVPGVVKRIVRPAAQRTLPIAPEYRVPELSDGQLVSLHQHQKSSHVATQWVMPALPKPDTARGETIDDLANGPRFTSFSRAPKLTNEKDIQRFLIKRFPRDLRNDGGDARAIVWLLIDTRGQVFKAVLHDTSGRAGADSLALAAGYLMSFEPAEQAGRPVPVWVQQPVRFQVRDVY
jgi:TonB family protein